MKFLRSLALAATTTLMAAAPLTSQAAVTLCLDDFVGGFNGGGIAATCIADGAALDLNPLAGAVTFIGAYAGFTLNVSTAIGEPLVIPAFGIDLSSVNIGFGNLLVAMTQDSLFSGAGGPTAITGSIGGTVSGVGASIDYAVWANDANVPFGGLGSMNGLAFFGTSGPGAFADTGGATLNLTDPYSLTSAVLIHHPNGGTTSFDLMAEVPEPASLALLGLAFAGAGFASRRRAGSNVAAS